MSAMLLDMLMETNYLSGGCVSAVHKEFRHCNEVIFEYNNNKRNSYCTAVGRKKAGRDMQVMKMVKM